MVLLGERSLRRALSEYLAERNHQGTMCCYSLRIRAFVATARNAANSIAL